MGGPRRVVGMLEAPGKVYEIGEPIKLRPSEAVRQFLSYLRDSIKQGTEIAGVLYNREFRNALRDFQPSTLIERQARKTLLQKLDRLGEPLPRAVAPQVIGERWTHGPTVIDFNKEEVRLIAKVALGGGKAQAIACQPAANAVLGLIDEWGLGKTEQLAGLQKGFAEQNMISFQFLYSGILERARQNLEALVAARGGTTAEQDSLRRMLFNSNGNVEEALRRHGALPPQQAQQIEAELNSIKMNADKLAEATKARRARRGIVGGLRPKGRELRIREAELEIREASRAINAARDHLIALLPQHSTEITNRTASIIAEVRSMGPGAAERHLNALRELFTTNPALLAYRALTEVERAALAVYTILCSKFPKLASLTNAAQIGNYLSREHPFWNKAASVKGALNSIKYWTSETYSKLAQEWMGRTHTPVTKRWGPIAIVLTALAAYAFTKTDFYTQPPVTNAADQFLDRLKREGRGLDAQFNLFHRLDGPNEKKSRDKLYTYLRANPEFVAFLDSFGFTKRGSIEYLKEKPEMVRFLKLLRIATTNPKALPPGSEWMADEVRGFAWDMGKRGNKYVGTPDKLLEAMKGIIGEVKYPALIGRLKQAGMLTDSKKLARLMSAGELKIIPIKPVQPQVIEQLKDEIRVILYPLPPVDMGVVEAVSKALLRMIQLADQKEKSRLDKAGIKVVEMDKMLEVSLPVPVPPGTGLEYNEFKRLISEISVSYGGPSLAPPAEKPRAQRPRRKGPRPKPKGGL